MKLGVVTTTINGPEALAPWVVQEHHNWQLYVAGDLKTPAAWEGRKEYYSPEQQKRWKSSELIGWNTDSRRNFAVLEALQDGCDVLVSVDDDMLPLHNDYFLWRIDRLFSKDFSGIQVGRPHRWMDHGQLGMRKARARGIPYDVEIDNSISFVVGGKIGVVQGIIYGVPDATAVDAIANGPVVTQPVEPLRSGFVAHPEAYAVFNSQLTAFRRELAPWFVQNYKTMGRNTDIFASLAMRERMRLLGWYTYYGPPGAWHDRSKRPLFNDLRAEMYGAEKMERFAKFSELSAEVGSEVWDTWWVDIEEAMK